MENTFVIFEGVDDEMLPHFLISFNSVIVRIKSTSLR